MIRRTIDPCRNAARRVPADAVTAAGIAQLAFVAAEGIAELAAEVHVAIARGWRGAGRDLTPEVDRAPLPYRIVSKSFALLASLASLAPRTDDSAPASGHWRRFESALNGVLGDTLATRDSALAIAMSVRDAEGTELDLDLVRAAAARGVVLFVHGLCASELEWHTDAHREFVGELETAGHRVGWLRYNSGRSIAENGRDLAELLEREFGDARSDRPLVLIGHSMGGLLIRSACDWATAHRHTWWRRVSHAAYLGSAHHGVLWERAGNRVNALLGLSRYSAPFQRLGNVRSRGIKDLRFGSITAAESAAVTDDAFADARRGVAPLLASAHHLVVAAALAAPRDRWLGDGLVPVHSALGAHPEAAMSLAAPRLRRARLEALNHVALMGDARTYALLRSWLADTRDGGHNGDGHAPATD